MEGDGEQPAFIIGRINPDHPVPDIKERLVKDGAVHEEDLHVPGLVDQEEPAAPVMRIRDHDRGGESTGNEFEAEGESGVCNFVRDGYVVKVAASGEFWLVRSGVPMAVGVGVGVRYPRYQYILQ